MAENHAPVWCVFVSLRRHDPFSGDLSDSGVHAGIPDLSGHAVVLSGRGNRSELGVAEIVRRGFASGAGGGIVDALGRDVRQAIVQVA